MLCLLTSLLFTLSTAHVAMFYREGMVIRCTRGANGGQEQRDGWTLTVSDLQGGSVIKVGDRVRCAPWETASQYAGYAFIFAQDELYFRDCSYRPTHTYTLKSAQRDDHALLEGDICRINSKLPDVRDDQNLGFTLETDTLEDMSMTVTENGNWLLSPDFALEDNGEFKGLVLSGPKEVHTQGFVWTGLKRALKDTDVACHLNVPVASVNAAVSVHVTCVMPNIAAMNAAHYSIVDNEVNFNSNRQFAAKKAGNPHILWNKDNADPHLGNYEKVRDAAMFHEMRGCFEVVPGRVFSAIPFAPYVDNTGEIQVCRTTKYALHYDWPGDVSILATEAIEGLLKKIGAPNVFHRLYSSFREVEHKALTPPRA